MSGCDFVPEFGVREVAMKKMILLAILLFALSGCLATAVSTAVDVGVEVVKVPFKVGGAIYDGVTGGGEDENKNEESDKGQKN